MDEELKSGWLIKSGEHLTWNLKRRWVVLTRSALTWYVKPTNDVFSGSLPIPAIASCKLSAYIKREHCFEVFNKSPTRIFFVAASHEEALMWIESIEHQVHQQNTPPLIPSRQSVL